MKLLNRLKSPILACLTAALVITCGAAIAQTSITGWRFNQSPTPNRITLNGVQYTGECSSGPIYPALTGSFYSEKTPPTPFTRVIVKNTTPGVYLAPYPFTNREYDERRPSSEIAKMSFSNTHQQRSFAVTEGDNTFEYTIKQRDRVLETGTFAATIETNLRKQERKATWKRGKVCANSSVSLNVCSDVRNRRAYECEDGRVLESGITPDDQEISTRIYNRTGKTFSFRVSGEDYTLSPGQYATITSSSSSSTPRIRYNSTCATCEEFPESAYLTPGKRYQFRSNGSKSIRLEDYSRDSGDY
jgi:hypothetical protein